MGRADGLHVDCRRDLGLAQRWGFPATRPSLIIPTNGGVQTQLFRPTPPEELPQASDLRLRLAQLGVRPIVVQPAWLPHVRPQRHLLPLHPRDRTAGA